MLIAGRFAVGNSPFLRGWQQEYMKAHGSMPPQDKVMDFLTSVVRNESIPMQNKLSSACLFCIGMLSFRTTDVKKSITLSCGGIEP